MRVRGRRCGRARSAARDLDVSADALAALDAGARALRATLRGKLGALLDDYLPLDAQTRAGRATRC